MKNLQSKTVSPLTKALMQETNDAIKSDETLAMELRGHVKRVNEIAKKLKERNVHVSIGRDPSGYGIKVTEITKKVSL